MFALLGLAKVLMLMLVTDLPVGSAPAPVVLPHFPNMLHAYVWRNWSLMPTERIAKAIDAEPEQIIQIGRSMGLPTPPHISADQRSRSALTVIRRNWHLLPYDQLLKLLDWTPEQLEYTLQEDDFLYIKLGSLKPKCSPIHWQQPDAATVQREHEIAAEVHHSFPAGLPTVALFQFVKELNGPVKKNAASLKPTQTTTPLSPRFCYSYFALYGDPLLDKSADPYPEGYLQRLHDSGVDGVWLQGVLEKLSPFAWDPKRSEHWEARLANLRDLVARARRHSIGVYLYLNEPRSMPLAFFNAHPDLKGVVEGDHATLCTSTPEVQEYIRNSIATICRAAPDLAGFFTITGSENLTNCWSHGGGKSCPRCGPRGFAEVVAEVNGLITDGIERAKAHTRLIAWDWGWPEDAAEATIRKLPHSVALMSVSEWDLPIHRGGVETTVGEYSLSAVGPGPRATRHWQIARDCGLQTIAKIQAANSWELSAVPYVPAVANSAQHAANLRSQHLNGIMLGWTLGGYPSPNLEVVSAVGLGASPADAMLHAAERRFGKDAAPAVVTAWQNFSTAFTEFPFHIGLVYSAPLQHGPANLLWGDPTGYHASMVGFPYDDLDTWRAVYPPEIFAAQLNLVANGFAAAAKDLERATAGRQMDTAQSKALKLELGIAGAVEIHYRSVANQALFILERRALQTANSEDARVHRQTILKILDSEITLAHRLLVLQAADPRIGFEASNQYYYVGEDLMEKILNCDALKQRYKE